jgi:hypothetical protein
MANAKSATSVPLDGRLRLCQVGNQGAGEN